MKNSFRKITAITLAALSIFSAAAPAAQSFNGGFSIAASAAEEKEYQSGYYTYTVDENDIATITKVDKSISGKVTIPSELDGYTVETIGEGVFVDCENLEELTIPNTVKEADRMATSYWSYTSNIKKVTFLEGRTEIPNGILEGAKSLESVEIPNTVTKVGKSAFNKCIALTDVYYYGTEDDWNEVVIESGNDPLLNATIHYIECPSYLHYEIVNGEAIIVDCDKEASGNIRIPRKLEGCPVTTIGQSAFYNCKDITGVVIPDTVKIIDEAAFYRCESLKEVKMSANIESIGVTAFAGCCIDSLELSQTLKTIGAGAFFEPQLLSIDYKALVEYAVENGISEIGEGQTVDELARGLENEMKGQSIDDVIKFFSYLLPVEQFVEFAPTKVTIDKNNPYLCSDSQGIIYNKDKTKVITAAGLKDSYVIPGSVKEIEDYAFFESVKAQSITLPKGLKTIGEEAFTSCRSLKEIIIPDSLTEISEGMFSDCTALENVVIPEGLKTIDSYAFKDCTSLEKLIIPESVTSFGENVFKNCDNLTIYCYENSAAQKYARDNNIKYTILSMPVESVAISDIKLELGESAKIVPEINPADESVFTTEFKSADASAVSVDKDGNIRALKEGKTVITCTVTDEYGNVVKDTCTVTVTADEDRTVVLPEVLDVNYKNSEKFKPAITVEEGLTYTVKYSSSDPSVAAVDKDGNITTHHKGTAVITCEVTDSTGKVSKDTCTVNVKFQWWQWIIWILLFGFLWY